MATTVKEVLGMAYTLLNNASEEELDYAVALEQYGLTVSEMQHEKISGYTNPEIIKATVTFDALTGEQNDTLSDLIGDVVFLRFNKEVVQKAPINMLDMYENMGQQAVAFYTDKSNNGSVKKIALAIKMDGDLEVWYEPRPTVSRLDSGNVDLEDAYKYLLACRLAYNCAKYVIYKDQLKEANKQGMFLALKEQASKARDLYIARVNMFDSGGRPFTRIPYNAG